MNYRSRILSLSLRLGEIAQELETLEVIQSSLSPNGCATLQRHVEQEQAKLEAALRLAEDACQ